MKRKFKGTWEVIKLSAEAEEIVKDEMKHLTREDLLLAVVNVEMVMKKNGEHRGFRYTLHLKDHKDGIVIRKCSTRIYENAYYSEHYVTPYAWSFGKKYNQPPQYKLIKEIPVTKKPCVVAYEAERQERIERHREARQQNEISPPWFPARSHWDHSRGE